MKIVIPGGSGQVGTVLARHFHHAGHAVVVLSRAATKRPWKVVSWDGQTLGPWTNELEGADALINLAGRVVNCRYNHRNRCEIWASRTRSVRILGRALETLHTPPRVWLQASTATIYEHRFDAAHDENSTRFGGMEPGVPDTWRFSIDVARAWEGEFALIDTPATRKVVLRSAMTMSPDLDGIFDTLLWLVRMGLGGAAASGNQYISWIHYADFVNAISFLMHNESIHGVVNIAAPNPIPNQAFMRILRENWGSGFAIPIREWMLELGAIFLQTESELLLKSRRVVSTRLPEHGFSFRYPTWDEAASDLCARWRDKRYAL